MTTRGLADWLAYLERLHPTAIDLGLERCRVVADRLGLGRPAPRVVTVTGTNGKGSTCAFIAALLTSAGLRVGVYSSPHLLRYNERVVIQGVTASDDALCEAFAAVEAARGEISLTYFEMGTLAAFWLFERAALDAVVLEVGLGGRLDAVNLVDADVAVVTNIGLDHAEWLGDTRASVATEKAGIFRAARPAICGDEDPPSSLLAAARSLAAPLLLRGEAFGLSIHESGWDWWGAAEDGSVARYRSLPLLPLPHENAALALQAVASLGLLLAENRVAEALRATRVMGRLDRRVLRFGDRQIPLMLDVGHNPHAAAFLARQMAEHPPRGQRFAVFGLLADKDLDGILDALDGCFDRWAVAPLDTPRSRSGDSLAAALTARAAEVSRHASVADALEACCAACAPGDELVVFGSFYCVAEGLQWLDRRGG